MTHVVEINNPEDLAGYRLLWNLLLPHTPGATFFHSLDWLLTYWKHYGHEQRMRVLVVYAAGQPLGILPLVVREERTRLGTMRILTYPLHDWGTYYGPIGASTTATLVTGLRRVRHTPRDWDLVDLRWVDKTTDRNRTPRALAAANLAAVEQPWMSSAQIDLSQGWESYWASRTSHWRTNVRRCEKKLAALGRVEYVRYRPAGVSHGDCDPRWDMYAACERIAEQSWQARSNTGTTLTHGDVRPYLRDAHEAAARFGALDVNLLLLDGHPVAFNYAYQYQGSVFGLRMGYDRALEAQGAGTVLQHRMIQDCCERGDHTYDLGAGYLECKRYWPTHVEQSFRYTHYPIRPRPQVLRAKRWLERRLSV